MKIRNDTGILPADPDQLIPVPRCSNLILANYFVKFIALLYFILFPPFSPILSIFNGVPFVELDIHGNVFEFD